MSDMEQQISNRLPESSISSNDHRLTQEGPTKQKVTTHSANIEDIDYLLSFLPPSESTKDSIPTTPVSEEATNEKVASEVDTLLQDIDSAIDITANEIKGWSLERKRQEARTSLDEFTLEVLANDESPIVKALALCNPKISAELLKKAGRDENLYFKMIAANNPSTPSEVLDELSTVNETEILQGVSKNPNISKIAQYKLKDKLSKDKLSTGSNDLDKYL